MDTPIPRGEMSYRRPRFVEGNWITLAGGERWCLPLPKDVPGHDAIAARAAGLVGQTIFGLMNPEGIMRQAGAAIEGDPAGLFATVEKVLAIYRGTFLAGSNLLLWNYDLSPEQCEELMPFNFVVGDPADSASKISRATPATFAIANAVGAICGIDFGSDYGRIAASN